MTKPERTVRVRWVERPADRPSFVDGMHALLRLGRAAQAQRAVAEASGDAGEPTPAP
jgi:hypothetical protein